MAFYRNLLIVLTHGLRADAAGFSRAWPLCTPNMDKLVERGLKLTAISASPVNPGGMLSLLTGLHARQHGYLQERETIVPCEGWPGLLKAAGYHVAGVGCVSTIEQVLDDCVVVDSVEVLDSSRCKYLTATAATGLRSAVVQQRRQRLRYGPFHPDRLLMEPDEDIDGFISVQARQMLTRMPSDKPWALIVIYSGPGNELPPPTLYQDVVAPELLEEGFVPPDFTELDALAELDYPRVMLQRLEPHQVARIRADYLGRVSLIDYGIGRMMKTIAEREDNERTWFVLGSDHGQLLGEHGLVGHRSFLCGAVEVPVIITPPFPASNRLPGALVSNIDVATTIAALGGGDVPPWMTGRSLLPLLAGDTSAVDQPHTGLLSEFGQRLLLETERYKLIMHTQTHRILGLYDLLNDPDEKTNLIKTMTGRNVTDALRWRLGDTLMPLRAAPRHI